METLISGRELQCKDMQGGISKLWLLPFEVYLRSQIRVVANELVLFPSSDYYLIENFNKLDISQKMNENEGGKYYDLSFALNIKEHAQLNELLNFNYRAVALDNLGNYRMLGLYNGLRCESIGYNSGSAKSDFNGITLNFNGQEIKEAPFLNSIDDVNPSFILQETGDFLLQENLGKFII